MPALDPISLPLPPNQPPSAFSYSERNFSELSSKTAFGTGIDARDVWRGEMRCIVCGIFVDLEHCHIIPLCKPDRWVDLRTRTYIPRQAKSVVNEPRNGLLMCPNHHKGFNNHRFFIRFDTQHKVFIFVNHSGGPDGRAYHGKAVNLDIAHHHAPFPAIFLIHEQFVRAVWPFNDYPINIPDTIAYQDWMYTDEVVSDPWSGTTSPTMPPLTSTIMMGMASGSGGGDAGISSGGPKPGTMSLALNAGVIQEILSATHKSASWRSCVQEGTPWEGTAEENIEKYKSLVDL